MKQKKIYCFVKNDLLTIFLGTKDPKFELLKKENRKIDKNFQKQIIWEKDCQYSRGSKIAQKSKL